MQEIEFTKEDEYCIRNFGYNALKDFEDLKQLEDENHLIIEELEYRLQQKENIIKEVREYIEDNFYQSGGCVGGTDLPYSYIEELLEILDKEN